MSRRLVDGHHRLMDFSWLREKQKISVKRLEEKMLAMEWLQKELERSVKRLEEFKKRHARALKRLAEKIVAMESMSKEGKEKLYEDMVQSDQKLSELFEGHECEQNGMKFYYEIKDDEEVTIYPLIDDSVTNLSIPSNVTIKGKNYKVSGIGKFSFKNNKTLKNIKLKKEIKNLTIGNGAFDSSAFEEITIPESVEKLTIGEGAFSDTKSFKGLEIQSDKIKGLEIGGRAFSGSSITSFTVPKSVENLTIGKDAFAYSKLKSLKSFIRREIRLKALIIIVSWIFLILCEKKFGIEDGSMYKSYLLHT